MNSWNFNELTQQDILDYKACQRQDGSIYGVPDKSDCQKGKEIKTEDLQALAKKANAGDTKATAQLRKIEEVNKGEKKKAIEEKKKKEAAAKKAEADKKGKKKGKGKKGGGKGKKGGGSGKGKGGGGGNTSTSRKISAKEAEQRMQKSRQERQKAMRTRLGDLQKSLRKVKNPELKKALEQQISDLLKGVNELSKQTPQTPTDPKAPGASGAPSAPQAPAPGKSNEKA